MRAFDQWEIKPKPQISALTGRGKKDTLLPHKMKQLLGVADFNGWGLVENVISLVFARFSTLLFSFSLFICPNGASVHTLPWVQEVVSRVRLGASFCRPKAEVTSGEAFRAGHFLRLTETGNRAWKASGTQGIGRSEVAREIGSS